MFQKVSKIIKWVSIPVLLIASGLSRFAASYELLVDMSICLGAVILVQRAVRMKEYYWACGFVSIVVVFSPLLLVVKIFLLMGVTGTATCITLLTAFRSRPGALENGVSVRKLTTLAAPSVAIPVAG